MRNTVVPVCVIAFASLVPSLAPLRAQDAAPKASPYVSVLGTVDKLDAAGKVISVKPDKGDPTTVKFNDQTTFMKMPAGETDTKKATPGAAGDIAVGDRVIARVLTADPTGKPARTVYIEKQSELAERRDKTQEEWKTATSGLVTAVDPGAIKITAKVPGSPAPKEITVDISGKVDFSHYNPETGKYEMASISAVKVGDQLRVLGAKNADSTQIKATDVGSGSFKTIGVQVKTIDGPNQISGIETGSKKPVIITLRADTSLKKFSDMAAMMVARQLNPTYQQTGRGGGAGGGGRGGGGGGAPGAGAQGSGAPGAGGPPSDGAARGPGRGGRNMDIGKIIEQQPNIQISDLKAGDAIIVTGATGNDSAKLVANALVAGVEPILRAAPSNGADPLAGSWNMGGGGDGN